MRILLSLMLLVCSSVAIAADYKAEYRMSVVVGSNLPWGEGATRFADLVRERSDGKINIKVYAASSLMAGKQTNEFLIMRQGVSDFALASTINWSSTIRELNLFNLPFLFPDYAAVDSVTQGEVGQMLADGIEKKGVTVLAWGENGFRELTNSVRPVSKPEDLKGLKIRVVGTPIFIDIMQAFEANPINMNWGEAKIAFQQGVVDGQENPVNSILIPIKIWDFHKNITFWRYVVDPLMLSVSNKTWEKFSPEDQALLRQAAIDATNWQKDVVRKGLIAPDLSAHEQLKAEGMTVTVLTAEQIEAFKALTKPVYDKWVPRIGEELVAKARAAIAVVPKAEVATEAAEVVEETEAAAEGEAAAQ